MTTPYKTTPASSGFTLAPGDEWTSRAAQWPLVLVTRETEPGHWLTDVVPAEPRPPLLQTHMCCAVCDNQPSVFCLSPDTSQAGYRVTSAHILAGIMRHLRESHDQGVASS